MATKKRLAKKNENKKAATKAVEPNVKVEKEEIKPFS